VAARPRPRDEELPQFLVNVSLRRSLESPLPERELARIAGRALFSAGAPASATLQLTFSNDVEIARLNAEYMGEAGPTDVLSFPMLPPSAFPDHPGKAPQDSSRPVEPSYQVPEGQPLHLGDIVVSIERAKAQAPGSVEDELRQLVVHGVLHICGWDHAAPEERDAMRALETAILTAP
jgi:probable rRNA maturation factor